MAGSHCCHVARTGATSRPWLGGATGPGWVTGWVTIMDRESSTDGPSNLVAVCNVCNVDAILLRSLAYCTPTPFGLRIFLHKSGKHLPRSWLTFGTIIWLLTTPSEDRFRLCPSKPALRAGLQGQKLTSSSFQATPPGHLATVVHTGL